MCVCVWLCGIAVHHNTALCAWYRAGDNCKWHVITLLIIQSNIDQPTHIHTSVSPVSVSLLHPHAPHVCAFDLCIEIMQIIPPTVPLIVICFGYTTYICCKISFACVCVVCGYWLLAITLRAIMSQLCRKITTLYTYGKDIRKASWLYWFFGRSRV